jgi:RNA polymerase sigma factor (sigma-70 family)
VAETFLAAFRQRGRYDAAHADARPWLYEIANRLISRYRRDEVRFFRAIARTGVDPAAELIADQVTSRVAAQAAGRELAAAIAALPPGYRDVLLLVASGLGYQETAAALGEPVGTVSSRLLRARRRVRALIGDPMRADDRRE